MGTTGARGTPFTYHDDHLFDPVFYGKLIPWPLASDSICSKPTNDTIPADRRNVRSSTLDLDSALIVPDQLSME